MTAPAQFYRVRSGSRPWERLSHRCGLEQARSVHGGEYRGVTAREAQLIASETSGYDGEGLPRRSTFSCARFSP